MIRRVISAANMRALKAEETSRFFASSAPQRPTRRVTRASAKLADPPPAATASQLADIEDGLSQTPRKRRRVADDEELPVKPEPASPAPPKPKRKPARTVKDPETGAPTTEPPTSWLETYNAVLEMRRPGGIASNAAVDTMGCERLADPGASERDRRFQTLVALMLSSQTKDTVNAAAMERLKTELPAWKAGERKGLNLENMLAVDSGTLNELIRAVGFHNNKTKCVLSLSLTTSRFALLCLTGD